MGLSKELIQAATDRDMRRVTALLALGAHVKMRDAEGWTVLHAAAQNGHAEMLKALAALGADKEARDAVGGRPLHAAAFYGHVEAVRALLQLGADLDAKTASGHTAHMLCIQAGHSQVALLLEAAAWRCSEGVPSQCNLLVGGRGACKAAAGVGGVATVRKATVRRQ